MKKAKSVRINVHAVLGAVDRAALKMLRDHGLQTRSGLREYDLLMALIRELSHCYLQISIAQKLQHSSAAPDFQVDISGALDSVRHAIIHELKAQQIVSTQRHATKLANTLIEVVEKAVQLNIGRGRGVGFSQAKVSYANALSGEMEEIS